MNAEIRPLRTAAEAGLIDLFERARATLPGGPVADKLRAEAFEPIARNGLPNRRVEEWKYTDLRALMREARPLSDGYDAAAAEGACDKAGIPCADARCIVFVNGRLAPELSDLEPGDGVSITSLSEAIAADPEHALALGGVPNDNAAVALNTAFVADGLMISVAAGAAPKRAIHVAHVQAGAAHAAYGRVLLAVGEGASVTLIESHAGDSGAHQTNTLVGLDLAQGAKTTIVKLQDEGLGTLHLATLGARLAAGARLTAMALSAGAAVSRQQIFLDFVGDKARADILGAGFAGGRRHLDTTLVVEHEGRGCASRELFKTALDGEARSVFQGKIVVRPGAQKTDGKMMAQALLLSPTAEADAKPELEIFADDVVCGHGATVGALDEELLFYLKSRGIPQAEAEALLVQAFVGEVVEALDDDALRDALMARAARWLDERV